MLGQSIVCTLLCNCFVVVSVSASTTYEDYVSLLSDVEETGVDYQEAFQASFRRTAR